jgi:hypothetical protein
MGWRGGYADEQLNENTFRVSFLGNLPTTPERASDFALLRAAELALEHGYSYCVIADSKYELFTVGTSIPATGVTTGAFSFTAAVGPVSYPNPWVKVTCYKECPQADEEIIDVRLLRDSLRHKYEIMTEEPSPP